MGDQILSIDETVIENTAFTPEDVMALLNANTNRGYTQIQILPAHAIARKGKMILLAISNVKHENQMLFINQSVVSFEVDSVFV